jgi:hypothetical protein
MPCGVMLNWSRLTRVLFMFFFGAQMIRACEIQTAKSCKGSYRTPQAISLSVSVLRCEPTAGSDSG